MSIVTGRCATLACLIEASVPKPGNVHRGADFENLTFYDFQMAAVAIGPAMYGAGAGAKVGDTVLAAIRATREYTNTNVNLGIVLLLAPLAGSRTREELTQELASLDAEDAAKVYEAIRLAAPGGLGRVEEGDVFGPPPSDLLQAMRSASDRDSIARQYVTDFEDVFDVVVPELQRGLGKGWGLADVVVRTHLHVMHTIADTLIARKCGIIKARQVAAWAGKVLDSGEPGDEAYQEALADLDFELRNDGHRLNPGTTADLICAGLFVALHDKNTRAAFKILSDCLPLSRVFLDPISPRGRGG